MVIVGGVDTYYDYDEQQWKYRRLGGGPIREPAPEPAAEKDTQSTVLMPTPDPARHEHGRRLKIS